MINTLRKLFGLQPKFRIKTKSLEKFNSKQIVIPAVDEEQGEIVIVNKAHTNFFAHLLGYHFSKRGIKTHMTPYVDEKFDGMKQIVFCPQTYLGQKLPEGFIGYQVEQTISDKFFQPEHMEILRQASSLIDYSKENVEFFKKNGFDAKRISHLPLTYCEGYVDYMVKNNILTKEEAVPKEREYDVVFYGDPRNPRRKAYLDELQKHFNVKIICGVFGEDVVKELFKAKVIVNIHFFDGAILEVGRIYEALSLGCHVVSETAIDQKDHACLDGLVDFCEIDDIKDMVEKVRYALDNPSHIKACREKVQTSNLDAFYNQQFDAFCANEFKKMKKVS